MVIEGGSKTPVVRCDIALRGKYVTADFRFDQTKSPVENCETLLATLETVDAEMCSFLRDDWKALVALVREEVRDSNVGGSGGGKCA